MTFREVLIFPLLRFSVALRYFSCTRRSLIAWSHCVRLEQRFEFRQRVRSLSNVSRNSCHFSHCGSGWHSVVLHLQEINPHRPGAPERCAERGEEFTHRNSICRFCRNMKEHGCIYFYLRSAAVLKQQEWMEEHKMVDDWSATHARQFTSSEFSSGSPGTDAGEHSDSAHDVFLFAETKNSCFDDHQLPTAISPSSLRWARNQSLGRISKCSGARRSNSLTASMNCTESSFTSFFMPIFRQVTN